MKKILGTSIAITVFVLTLFFAGYSQEQITITTYYPSPFGSYNELRANRMAVSPTRAMPTTDGALAWGDARGLLTPDQGASIELGGTGTPYIDFSNDLSTNYDARLMLADNNTFRFQVGREVQVRNRDNTNWADIEVRDIYLCSQ